MKISAENINALWGNLIIEELLRNGPDYFCISPGSRSAPLTVAVARRPEARKIICFDERAAAFHALGYARATGNAAVLICTSGTAVANYLPAVIEAALDHLPLVVLSADRPPELRQTAANQAIEQVRLFGDYVKWQFDLPCPDSNIAPEMVLTTIDQLCHQAHATPAGPVHLNCMFREPLAPLEAPFDLETGKRFEAWQNDSRPYTQYRRDAPAIDERSLETLFSLLQNNGPGIIVAGRLKTAAEGQVLAGLGEHLNWPVFADINSGIRLGQSGAPIVHYFDQLLLSARFRSRLAPEIVLHLGSPLLSRRWQQFIADRPPRHYVVIQPHPFREDPAHRVTHRIEADPLSACRQLTAGARLGKPNREWLEMLRSGSTLVEEMLTASMTLSGPVSEISAAYYISKNIPGGSGLFLASSMPVRDMDMYGAADAADLRVAANRGASGIDGTIASAAGFAAGLQAPVTLLTGDLALLHDLNSLQMLQSVPQPFIIVAINNQGGGIFSFLPIARVQEIFETYFGTPHSLEFEHAAKMFSLDYYCPASNKALLEVYRQAQEQARPTLIEIRTDRRENHTLHLQLQNKIAARLDSL